MGTSSESSSCLYKTNYFPTFFEQPLFFLSHSNLVTKIYMKELFKIFTINVLFFNFSFFYKYFYNFLIPIQQDARL